jgi:antitoxin ParD1/3/4
MKKSGVNREQRRLAAKLSISLPESIVQFIEDYKATHHYASRAEVMEEALKLLRYQELEEAYRSASQETDSTWDVAIADGLTNEAW